MNAKPSNGRHRRDDCERAVAGAFGADLSRGFLSFLDLSRAGWTNSALSSEQSASLSAQADAMAAVALAAANAYRRIQAPEDIAQEVLVRLLKTGPSNPELRSLSSASGLVGYIFTMARRIAIDMYRSAVRRRQQTCDFGSLEASSSEKVEAPPMIDAYPPRAYAILQMFGRGLTVTQMALVLDCHPGTVCRLLTRLLGGD